MRMTAYGLAAGALLAASSANAMSVSFSWAGVPRCSGASPAFSISGAPKGVASLRFAMRDYHAPNYNHGGSTIAYSGGRVPQGAISYIGPCPPPAETHRYIWTVEALDAAGKVLATARAEANFPPK